MFGNLTAVKQGHESAQQAPESTLDMQSQFGEGTLQQKDTGAHLPERSLQVQITNPGMRHMQGAGKAVREEKKRLTARTVDVAVRSGNQRPNETMDTHAPEGFIWGYQGTGEAPRETLAQKVPTWGWVALAIGGIWMATR